MHGLSDPFALAWLGLTTFATFSLFGYDKWLAKRGTERISEFQLVAWAALGGWVGGVLAMMLFRHKTAKGTFLLKYALAFLVWLGLVYLAWRRHG